MKPKLPQNIVPMAVYALVLIASLNFLRAHPASAWRVPVAVAPVLPIAFVVLNTVRRVRAMDELQRRKHLEAAAFAYPAMVILSITYGFLQNVGFPQVNWMFAGVDLIILYGLGQLMSWWRYR